MDPLVISAFSGAGVVVGWLTKHYTNGKVSSTEVDRLLEHAVETKTLVAESLRVGNKMADMQTQLAEIIKEIERRGRRSEEAIRKVLGD